MTEFPVSPVLPEDMLARCALLPLKPDEAVLIGRRVRLQPLDLERDVPLLHVRSNGSPAQMGVRSIDAYDADALVWRYMSVGPFADEAALRDSLREQVNAPDRLALCVIDRDSESPVGVVNLMSNSPANLSIELGSIWYSPLAQGTGANSEAAYLMLLHVFSLGYRRVVWKCDALNARSRAAAQRIGFQFEGIHEQHMILKGRNRDTAWFRILDSEWANVRAGLELLVAE